MRTTTEILQTMLSQAKQKVYQDQLIKRSKISPQMFKKYEQKLLRYDKIYMIKKRKRYVYGITKKGETMLQSLSKLHKIRTNILRNVGLAKNQGE